MASPRLLTPAILAAGLSAMAALPAAALPAEITVAQQNASNVFGGPTERWFEDVKASVTLDGKTTGAHVYAGLYRMKSDAPAEGLLARFDAFCIDFIGVLTNPPGLYGVNGPVFNDGAGGPAAAAATEARVAGFWNAFVGLVNDARTATAFQVGLWEVKYDNAFALDKGAFKVSHIKTETKTLLGSWFSTYQAMIDAGKADTDSRFITLDSAKGQDLLTPVPLPGAAALLLGALGAFGWVGRRRAA